MNLRVFADESGHLHLEISSPALVYKRKVFVPMFEATAQIQQGVDPRTLVDVWYRESLYRVAYLFVHSGETEITSSRVVGELEDSDSRNVLNHILDILAWDSR